MVFCTAESLHLDPQVKGQWETLKITPVLETSKSAPNNTPPSTITIAPNPSQPFPLSRDQVSKHVSLWGGICSLILNDMIMTVLVPQSCANKQTDKNGTKIKVRHNVSYVLK